VYNATRAGWDELIGATERLNWQKATSMLAQIEKDAHEFRQLAGQISEILDVYKCMLDEETALKKQRPLFPMSFALPVAGILVVITILLYIFYGRSGESEKMKIN